jgi:hypothetical protein
MSVISSTHTYTTLDKASKAFAGQRLIKLIAKGENKHINLQSSLCVSVPLVTQDQVADYIDKLLPHVVGLVQDVQDKIAREHRIETGHNIITDDDLSLTQVIKWLDENAAGDRVTTEYMAQWFADEYQDAAHQYIAHIMQLDVVNGEIPPVVIVKGNILREMFVGFASPKYSPPIPKLKAMIKFASSVSDLDARMTAIVSRATVMLARKEAELEEDALGFGTSDSVAMM